MWENMDSSNDGLPNVILPRTVYLMSSDLQCQFAYYVRAPGRLMDSSPIMSVTPSLTHRFRKGETCFGGVGWVRLG